MRTSLGYPLFLLALAVGTVFETRAVLPMDTSLFRDIARRQNPAVVSLLASSDARPDSDDEATPGWLFGRLTPFDHSRRAHGAGFLISPDGDILTNNHVVAGADRIEVSLFGDPTRTYRAVIVGRDPLTDSALIRLQNGPTPLPVVTLGDSSVLEPGDWVMAIGDPYLLGHSVAVGVVSFSGRPFQVQDGRWQNLIQTSMTINPGNSGGPLTDVRGEVIGINAAVLADAMTGTAGIGFAVPINTIKALLPQLRAGRVVRGWLGIRHRVEPIAEDEAKALGLMAAYGVIVVAVEPGSPAASAGVRAGDVITGLDGTIAADANYLGAQIAASFPGTRRTLTVERDGQTRTVPVTIGEQLRDDDGPGPVVAERRADFGLTLDELTASLVAHLKLPEEIEGAVVTDLDVDGPAAHAGLQPGDVITTIARRAVRNADEARRALDGVGAGEPVFVLLWRSGQEHFLDMRWP